jgi:DNA-binding NtrC family response regulator
VTSPACTAGDSRVRDIAGQHHHSLSHVLIVGGTAAERERMALAVHAESGFRSGPFVAVNCATDEPTLRIALRHWLTTTGRPASVNPLWPAERGTLYLESVEALALETQRQLLTIAKKDFALPSECGTRRVGRLVVGSHQDPWNLVAEDRFLGRLADVLDKIRVELDPRSQGGAA